MKILENSNKPFTIIEYLKNGFKKNELTDLLNKLNLNAISLIRTNESDYKENFKLNMSNPELIKLIIKYPKIFQRPIIVINDKAVIGRPPDNIYRIL